MKSDCEFKQQLSPKVHTSTIEFRVRKHTDAFGTNSVN